MLRWSRRIRQILRSLPMPLEEPAMDKVPVPRQLAGKRYPISFKVQTALELRESLEDLVLLLEALIRKSEALEEACSMSLSRTSESTRQI